MRRVRALLAALSLVAAACSTTGGLPRQPFADIPAPPSWRPYTQNWAMISTPRITAARLVYASDEGMESTLASARQGMLGGGWSQKGTERFVSAQGFDGVWADFAKGEDTCRVTVTEARYGSQVDVTTARVPTR
jgi:hypothetical protein